jgi:hypothetical protein
MSAAVKGHFGPDAAFGIALEKVAPALQQLHGPGRPRRHDPRELRIVDALPAIEKVLRKTPAASSGTMPGFAVMPMEIRVSP